MKRKLRILESFDNFKKIVDEKDNEYKSMEVYFEEVKDSIVNILIKDKNMSNSESIDFVDKMFTMDSDREKEIKNDINNYHIKSKKSKECAKFIINNYYKLTKMNKYDVPNNHEEITEVTESVKSFYHYKNVSDSLFWYFIKKINNLNLKFEFNTVNINNNENSLNNKKYLFYIETDNIDKEDVNNEFISSRTLSSITSIITNDLPVKFFIAINKKNILKFGYIYNNNVYIIGKIKYKTSDIKKLSSYIKSTDSSISFYELCNSFKSTISIINYYRNIFDEYLSTYIGLNIYISIINNKITLIIETDDDSIVNEKYIHNIITENNLNKLKENSFNLFNYYKNNKTYYYINLK